MSVQTRHIAGRAITNAKLGTDTKCKAGYVYEDFKAPAIAVADLGGGAATGTAGDVNFLSVGGTHVFEYVVKATQTILGPVRTSAGLNISQDQTDDDGVEYTLGILSRGESVFTCGTSGAFSFSLKFSIVDVSGTDDCAVGFRKAEAYQANIDDYDEMAVLNAISGNITIETILNNGATTVTDTTNDWADGETHTLKVKVSAARAVTYLIDGVAPIVTAAFTFDSGEVVVPFFFFLHAADVAGAVTLIEWISGLDEEA